MELWIRSQDREHLINTTDIDLDCDDKTIILINNYDMAKYKTKERALEVLDEIQDLLDTKKSYEKIAHMITKDTKIIEFSTAIYEMPKE